MSLAAFLVVAVAALLSLGYLIGERIVEKCTGFRHRVVVNLADGRAFTGVLYARRRNLLVLKNAQLLEKGVSPVPLDGDVIVDRVRVDFIQVAAGTG